MPLTWHRADDYHLVSDCGRYTVSRVTASNARHFIAWLKPYRELASEAVPLDASESVRNAAIEAMKAVCATHLESMPAPHQ